VAPTPATAAPLLSCLVTDKEKWRPRLRLRHLYHAEEDERDRAAWATQFQEDVDALGAFYPSRKAERKADRMAKRANNTVRRQFILP
jgi:hypothetical protein